MCPDDYKAMDERLARLPGRLAAVAGELMPRQGRPGEGGGPTQHIHTRPPVDMNGLSLIGPGADVTPRLNPLVRHWSVKRKVQVTTHVVGVARQVEVEVTDWFHEAVIGADGRPVLVAEDDQVGLVPPREWADQQVRRWRSHFGHHVPARTLLRRQRPYFPPPYLTLLRVAGGNRVVAFLTAVHAVSGANARLAYRGLNTDPEMDILERRGGPDALLWDVDYLRTWLPRACEQDALEIAEFAAQLRAMHAEIDRALGETPDQEWVGRCPAFIAELDEDGEATGRKKPCGGELWQDNTAFSAQVQCPRCRSTWDTRGHAGAGTAREIRRVWPVDRRRRYTIDEIDLLVAPKCPGCGNRVKIEWRDATGTRDTHRTWQPIAARCDIGCDEARRVL